MSAEPKNAYNAHVVGGVDNSEHEGPAGSDPIFKTPLWVTVVRGFQAFFGFIILILSGLVIHGLALDASVFALVCGLFTLIIVGYTLLSEKAVGCHKAYNYWAHMSLDLLMAIFWLSSMGANAALRASFTVSVNADCWSDGSAVNSGHCNIYRRTLEKRVAVATKLGLSCMAATAGLSALQMLLFIATLAYLAHQVRLHLQANKKSGAADNGQVEMNAQQSQPMLNQQYQPQQNTEYPSQVYPQQAQQPQAPYDPHSYGQTQQQQQPQQYQQQPQQPPQQYQQQYQQYPEMAGTPAPEQQYQQQYPQSTATPAPEQQYQYGYPQQQQQQHQYAPAYASPTATPAPQQPYHPPQ